MKTTLAIQENTFYSFVYVFMKNQVAKKMSKQNSQRKITKIKQIAYKLALFSAMALAISTCQDKKPKAEKNAPKPQNKTEVFKKDFKITPEDKKTFQGFIDTLAISECGKYLLENADTARLTMFNYKQASMAVYQPAYHSIAFQPEYNNDLKIALLTHEMTHAKQSLDSIFYKNGYSPENFILLNRAIEADACAKQAHILWQLKQQGITKPWEEMRKDQTYGDILIAYEKEALKDPQNNNNIKAIKAAYNQWFKLEFRCNYYDAFGLRGAFLFGADAKKPEKTVKYFSNEKDVLKTFAKMGQVSDSVNYLITGTASDSLTANWYIDRMSKENMARLDSLKKIVRNANFTESNRRPSNRRKLFNFNSKTPKNSRTPTSSPPLKPKRVKLSPRIVRKQPSGR